MQRFSQAVSVAFFYGVRRVFLSQQNKFLCRLAEVSDGCSLPVITILFLLYFGTPFVNCMLHFFIHPDGRSMVEGVLP